MPKGPEVLTQEEDTPTDMEIKLREDMGTVGDTKTEEPATTVPGIDDPVEIPNPEPIPAAMPVEKAKLISEHQKEQVAEKIATMLVALNNLEYNPDKKTDYGGQVEALNEEIRNLVGYEMVIKKPDGTYSPTAHGSDIAVELEKEIDRIGEKLYPDLEETEEDINIEETPIDIEITEKDTLDQEILDSSDLLTLDENEIEPGIVDDEHLQGIDDGDGSTPTELEDELFEDEAAVEMQPELAGVEKLDQELEKRKVNIENLTGAEETWIDRERKLESELEQKYIDWAANPNDVAKYNEYSKAYSALARHHTKAWHEKDLSKFRKLFTSQEKNNGGNTKYQRATLEKVTREEIQKLAKELASERQDNPAVVDFTALGKYHINLYNMDPKLRFAIEKETLKIKKTEEAPAMIASLQEKIATLEAKLAEQEGLKTQLESSIEKLDKAKEELEAARKENEELKAEIERLKELLGQETKEPKPEKKKDTSTSSVSKKTEAENKNIPEKDKKPRQKDYDKARKMRASLQAAIEGGIPLEKALKSVELDVLRDFPSDYADTMYTWITSGFRQPEQPEQTIAPETPELPSVPEQEEEAEPVAPEESAEIKEPTAPEEQPEPEVPEEPEPVVEEIAEVIAEPETEGEPAWGSDLGVLSGRENDRSDAEQIKIGFDENMEENEDQYERLENLWRTLQERFGSNMNTGQLEQLYQYIRNGRYQDVEDAFKLSRTPEEI